MLFPAGSQSGKVPQQDHPVEPSVDLKVKEVNTLSKLVSNLKSVRALMHKVHQEITLSRFWEMEVGEIMDVQGS